MKAFVVRIRKEQDVKDFKAYIDKFEFASISNIYQYDINIYGFKKDDYVLALSVYDRSDLWESMIEEIGYCQKPYYMSLEQLPNENGRYTKKECKDLGIDYNSHYARYSKLLGVKTVKGLNGNNWDKKLTGMLQK